MIQRNLNKKYIGILIGAVLANPLSYVLMGASSSVYAEIKESANFPININEQSEVPNIFNIVGSNKVVMDFLNYPYETPSIQKVSSDNPLIKNVEVRKVSNRLRIVFEMKSPVRYSVKKDKGVLTFNASKSQSFDISDVSIASQVKKEEVKQTVSAANVDKKEMIEAPKKAISTATNTVVTTPLKAEQNIETKQVAFLQVDKINIKKTPEKTAKIVIDFNKKGYTPIINKEGDNLIVDLKDVGIANQLQKNVDVRPIATLVNTMDVATQKGSGRIILSQKPNWDYSYYQTDTQLVIEIKSKQIEVAKPKYSGKPLTLNFQNMEVRSILQVIADFTSLNILASDSVSGSMSVRLKDVPWDQALDLVLETKGLERVQQGNVIWIATREEISNKNKNQIELNTQAAELSPLVVEYITLNHYKAAEMKAVIEGDTKALGITTSSNSSGSTAPKGLLTKKGSVGLDIRNNTIFVQDTQESINNIKNLVRRLDMPTKQVIIEAKLVIATDRFGKDIGARFGIGARKDIGKGNSIGIGPNLSASQLNSSGNPLLDGSSAYDGSVPGGSLGFTILNALAGNFLSFELSALEENRLGQVISSPRLITADNKRALIQQGTQIPFTIPGTAASAPTVNFKDAVLSLGVTPQVSPNGRINMQLDIKKDTVGQTILLPGGGSVPSIDTRSILTDVTVNNGQTVVLGGVYEVTSADDLSKVPFFGDLPFLGNLFKQKSKSKEKAELLIFITPHVVNDEDLDNINRNTPIPTEIELKR